MGDEGPHADHLRLEFIEELQILHYGSRSLPRRTYHKSSPGLKTAGFESVQASFAAFPRLGGGMEQRIMLGVGGFVPQEETVRSCFAQAAIGILALFSYRKSDGAVRPAGLHLAQESNEAFIGEPSVFSALHHEGAEAEAVAVFTAFQYLLRRQAIAFDLRVAATYAAIAAVLATEIRYLNKAAHIDALAEMLLRAGPCAAEEFFAQGGAFLLRKGRNIVLPLGPCLVSRKSGLSKKIPTQFFGIRRNRSGKKLRSAGINKGCELPGRREQTGFELIQYPIEIVQGHHALSPQELSAWIWRLSRRRRGACQGGLSCRKWHPCSHRQRAR